jgi:hypothetical protein
VVRPLQRGSPAQGSRLSFTPRVHRSSRKSLTVSDHSGATTGGGKPLSAHVISDNKLQLKFQTRQFVGEYFYYSGDLSLIYKSEKLAKFNCSRD